MAKSNIALKKAIKKHNSKYTKESLEKAYLDIAFKLGKIPSTRDVKLYVCDDKTFSSSFNMSFAEFKEMMVQKHLSLKELCSPREVTLKEILELRSREYSSNVKSSNKKLTKDAELLQAIEVFAKNVFANKIKNVKAASNNKKLDRTHNLVLSDLHIGSDLKSDETGAQDYGTLHESRKLAYVIKEACSYKVQYRSNTKLKLLLLGDIIENQLHDPRTGAVLAEQAARAIHLLSQAIAQLALAYPTVEVECQTGNHGRNTSRHPNRAIHQKFDSIETIIYTALKYACVNLKNVVFNIPKMPLSSYTVYGMRIGVTHGDTVINPGNPGSSVNTRSLETQVNRINAALPDSQEYAAIVYGHTHVPHMIYLGNGTVLIGNGSLPPPDHFAVSIGILEAVNGQYIFESVPGHAVGDIRLIKAPKDCHNNKSLDDVIKPWAGF